MRCMTRKSNPEWQLRAALAFALACLIAGLAYEYWHTPLHADTKPVVSMTLQNAQTTGNGTVVGAGYMGQCRESAIYVVWGAGTNAGVFTIESAHDNTYTGTWAPLATVTWSAASKQDIVQITGVHMALRARISTTVTGGTASAFFICN